MTARAVPSSTFITGSATPRGRRVSATSSASRSVGWVPNSKFPISTTLPAAAMAAAKAASPSGSSSAGVPNVTSYPMRAAPSAVRRSTMSAWIDRLHGHRPTVAMLSSSIATMTIRESAGAPGNSESASRSWVVKKASLDSPR